MEARETDPLANDILAHWDGLAQTLFPDGPGEGLANLVADLAGASPPPGGVVPPVAFGDRSAFLYRLGADFTVDRPKGPIGRGYTEGALHQSVRYRPLHGGSFWAHLAVFTLAHLGLEAIRQAGFQPSATTARLAEKSGTLNRLLETLMFSPVNLFAQCAMLEKTLDRVEGELRSLEADAGLEPPMTAGRARLLGVILEEKSGQVEANVRHTLGMLGSL